MSAVPVPANRQALRREAEGDALTPTLSRGERGLLAEEAGITWSEVALGALLSALEGARTAQ